MGENKIGLPFNEAQNMAQALNRLLASYIVASQNFHALHWLIRGKDFFILHAQFDGLYTGALATIDTLAERVLTLGYMPDYTLERFLAISEIKSLPLISDGTAGVKAATDTLQALAHQLRQTLEIPGLDPVTVDFITGLLTAHEKTIWMFSAYLNEAPAALGD